MRSFLVAFLLVMLSALPLVNSQAQNLIWPAHLDTAVSYVGTREVGHNSGRIVAKFLRSVNLPKGNPWCAAFGSYDLTAAHVRRPRIRSGLATNFITKKSIPAKEVLRGLIKIKPGTIGIMRHGSSIHGHFYFVIRWNKASGITVEGNTRPTGMPDGPQGVWIKHRNIIPGNYFRTVDFTPVNYS